MAAEMLLVLTIKTRYEPVICSFHVKKLIPLNKIDSIIKLAKAVLTKILAGLACTK